MIFLSDASTSMTIADEASGQSRWDLERKTLAQAREVVQGLGDGLTVKFYRFDKGLRDDPADDKTAPDGQGDGRRPGAPRRRPARDRDAGGGGRRARRRLEQRRARRRWPSPAGCGARKSRRHRRLRGRERRVRSRATSPSATSSTSPTVFVKNNLQVKGTLVARGFPNETARPGDARRGAGRARWPTQRIKVPASAEVIPFTGLNYRPQTPGEKRITVRVKPKEGELVQTNNSYSTFVTVLKGGLNVLFVQGPHAPWEQKFWMLSVASSPDIQADLRVVRSPAPTRQAAS